jgi:hypothetical protein
MGITATEFKEAIDLLEKFRTDYQFNKEDEGYLGFLNVGPDLLDESDLATWFLICNRAQIFMPIIHELGLETEEGLNLEETVFILDDC